MTFPGSIGAVRSGPGQIDAGQDVAGRIAAGQIVPILDRDPARAVETVLVVRASGGIPLVGDDRWDADHWAALREYAEASPYMPQLAWATFSSGSSGAPRVILRTERSWSASFDVVTELMQLTDRDTVLLPAPLASSLSLFSVAHARAVGAGILFPRAHALAAGDLDGATAMHGTPQSLATLVDAVESGARHTLRTALIGGARVDDSLRSRAEARGIRVISYYGAAELSFVAVDVDGSGLRPFPGVELRLVDGEVWVRSPYVAEGYLGAAVGSLRRGDEGWATVGDLAEGDAATALLLKGRRDGAILTAAATVIPEDVEAALRAIDGISDAVVFGLPNAGAGSLVAAVVEVASRRYPPSLRDVREQAATRLAVSHRPRRWFWTERLERTLAGKPARARIADDAIAGRLARLE